MNGVGVIIGRGRYLLAILLTGIVPTALVWDKLPIVSRFRRGRSAEREEGAP